MKQWLWGRDSTCLSRVTSTPGGNVPSDPALASAIAIPIALGVGMNAEAAVALAVPFGVLGVFMDQLRRTINATWAYG